MSLKRLNPCTSLCLVSILGLVICIFLLLRPDSRANETELDSVADQGIWLGKMDAAFQDNAGFFQSNPFVEYRQYLSSPSARIREQAAYLVGESQPHDSEEVATELLKSLEEEEHSVTFRRMSVAICRLQPSYLPRVKAIANQRHGTTLFEEFEVLLPELEKSVRLSEQRHDK